MPLGSSRDAEASFAQLSVQPASARPTEGDRSETIGGVV